MFERFKVVQTNETALFIFFLAYETEAMNEINIYET